jgi:hypothetical protein
MVKEAALLYVSSLAMRENADGMASLLRPTRAQACEAGVTGVLLFDGVTMIHYLEGGEQALEGLLAIAGRGPSAANLQILYRADVLQQRRFADWKIGFPIDIEVDLRLAAQKMAGTSAPVSYFGELLRHFDMM